MTEKYEHKFDFVEGPLESDMEMKCIGGKDPIYHLCLRNADGTGMYVVISKITLHSRDRYVDAKAVEESTKSLGDEIARRWNARPGMQPCELCEEQFDSFTDEIIELCKLASGEEPDRESDPIEWLKVSIESLLDDLQGQEVRLRIQHLNYEKERLKKRYEKSLAEINSHLKNCEEHKK